MISNKLTKTLSLTLFVFIFLILGSFTINKAQAQWVDAPGNPPGYGVASQWDYKPITKGLNPEYKTGNLGIGRNDASADYALYIGGLSSRGIRVIGDSFYEGNIGIGTENPTARLQIGDTTPNSGNQIVLGKYDTTSDSNLPVIQQKNITVSGSSNDLALGARSTYGGVVLYTGATDISNVLGTNLSQPRLTVTNAGNVGIGTTAPNKKLHIYQDSGDNAEINLQSVSGSGNHWGIYNDRATNDLRFWQGDNILTIKENGNVGIGTTNPTERLQVEGNARVDGIRFPDNTLQTTASSGGVPSGAVLAFNLASCPSGWSSFTSARNRTIVGSGGSYGRGATGGASTVTLTIAQIPAHNHNFSQRAAISPGAGGSLGGGDGNLNTSISFNTATTGGNQPHNNMQPYIALLYCVKN